MSIRESIERQLGAQRRHVLTAVSALTPEQLHTAALPSGWTPAGVVRHLTLDVERWWFRRVFVGEHIDVDGPNGSAWKVRSDESAEAVIEAYQAELEVVNAIISTHDLDAPLVWWPTELMGPQHLHNLGDLLLHVTTETACHAGHLDAARELMTGGQWLVLG